MELVGLTRPVRPAGGLPEESGATVIAEQPHAGRGIIDGEVAGDGPRGHGHRANEQQGGLIPRAGLRSAAEEQRLGGTDGGTKIIGRNAAEREKIGAVVGAVPRDRAIGLQEIQQELRGLAHLMARMRRQAFTFGHQDDLRPRHQLQKEAVVIRRVLAEPAICVDEGIDLREKRFESLIAPAGGLRQVRPQRSRGEEPQRLADAMVVPLRKRVR